MKGRRTSFHKSLSALRRSIRILENNLREKDYTFDYGQQPSKAMFKYRRAFLRNDEARYRDFMQKVNRGEANLHTGTLMPYEIVEAAYRASQDERAALDATWKALEDFTDGENALVVADGSGSMYWGKPQAAAVAQSLAIYFAQRNRGAFRNHFITFSTNPRQLYRRHGYRLPRVVFWNVQSRNQQQPVRSNAQGVALVSGFTARIFSQVMSGEMDPYRNMLSVVDSERYSAIRAG